MARTFKVWNRYQFADRNIKEKILILSDDKDGYKLVGISNKTQKVHRLVAEAFIPNPENKPVVNHINGLKNDNRIENLEWCTLTENEHHAYNSKLMRGAIGKKNGNSKYGKELILKIKYLLDEGIKPLEICKKLEVNEGLVRSIQKGRTWSHLTGYLYNGRIKKFKGQVNIIEDKIINNKEN